METGMNTPQYLVFLSWLLNCITSQVVKVYFSFNEILWVLTIKLLLWSKTCANAEDFPLEDR